MLVSHGVDYDGGAEFVFNESLRCLRGTAPGRRLIAVYPGDGPLARDGAAVADEIVVAWVPRWAYFGRLSPRDRAITWWHLFRATAQAVRLLLRVRPEVVASNTMTIPAHAFAAALLRVPHHWMVQEFGRADHGLSFLAGYERTQRTIAALSDSVVCCSQAVANEVRSVAPRAVCRVVHYAVESPVGLPQERRRDLPLRAALVGRYAEGKGQHLAIRAVAEARTQGIDVHLRLVGPGDPGPLVALAEQLAVTDLVTLVGHTDEVFEEWRRADVALMCSRAEAFGRVTVEAMRAGLPVCGIRSGGTVELIKKDYNGLLSEPDDAQALGANLVLLAHDESYRRQLAHGASQFAAGFTATRYGEELASALLTRRS